MTTDRVFNPVDPEADVYVEPLWPDGLNRPNRPPNLLYLDLNHWIGLAQASTGHQTGDGYRAALTAVRACRRSGSVLCPLSATHYEEVAKITNRRRRRDLAAIMEELSGFQTLASRTVIMRLELEAVLDRHLGTHLPQLGPVDLLGYGSANAFGVTRQIYYGPDPNDLSRQLMRLRNLEVLEALPAWARTLHERSVLAGPQSDEEEAQLRTYGWKPSSSTEVALKRAGQERGQAEILERTPQWRQSRLRDVVAANEAAIELIFPLLFALERRGVGMEGLFATPVETRAFMRAMPSMEVAIEMKTRYHRNVDSRWDSNTVYDVDAMALGVPYCDAVATEKHACDTLRRGRLDETMSTELMARPAELASWLEKQS